MLKIKPDYNLERLRDFGFYRVIYAAGGAEWYLDFDRMAYNNHSYISVFEKTREIECVGLEDTAMAEKLFELFQAGFVESDYDSKSNRTKYQVGDTVFVAYKEMDEVYLFKDRILNVFGAAPGQPGSYLTELSQRCGVCFPEDTLYATQEDFERTKAPVFIPLWVALRVNEQTERIVISKEKNV